MPGVFGVITSDAGEASAFLDRARGKLGHFPWYTLDTCIVPDMPVGLGRVGIGIFNREPQPVVSTDGQVFLFMAGEFYKVEALRSKLEVGEHHPRDTTPAELALSAYLTFGEDFAEQLEGAFVVAVFDRNKGKFTLTNDRFALYPTYYYHERGKLVLAPEVAGVLCAAFVPRKLNLTATAEYMRFQELLGLKTFHEGILLFPPASTGVFDLSTGEWTIHRYWDWDQIPDRPEIGMDEAVRETARLLRAALDRMTADSLRPGVFLTGGLDSRTILGLLPRSRPMPLTATFGIENCRDVHYARRIARVMGAEHLWFDLPDGQWVLDNIDLHLKLTEGFHSWIHMHGISMLPALRERMDYNLTGWAAEVPLGHPDVTKPAFSTPIDRVALLNELFQVMTQLHTWPGLTEAEMRMLYTPEYARQLVGRAFDSLAEELTAFERYRPSNRMDYFFLMNHVGRMTRNMITIARSHLETRFPYWDYDFVDFAFSLNHKLREGKPRGAVYLNLLTRELPRLALIPNDKDDFLPTANRRLYKAHSFIVRARKRLGLYPQRTTLYADYENYLRRELRAWAEGILFDRRTHERGIFNMVLVRSLMDRHLSGREEWTIGKIAPLMTFEMVMREYFD